MLPSEIPKLPHRLASERISWCLETSPPSWLAPWDGSPTLTHLSLFLSCIFCPTSFWREWAAFLGAWCALLAFRNCFVEVAQNSNEFLINLWGRKWSPCPIPWHLMTFPPWWGVFSALSSVQFISISQFCLTLCKPMHCSMPGLLVYHQLLECTQSHVHWVSDAIQLSQSLSSPSPPSRLPPQDGSLSPTLFVSLCLLYFALTPSEENGLSFWVPNVLCQHSEVVLWIFLSV